MQLSQSDRRLLIWFLVALLIALLPWVVLAQSPQKERVNVNKKSEDTYDYNQVVKVGNTIYLSGITRQGSIKESIKPVYESIQKSIGNGWCRFC